LSISRKLKEAQMLSIVFACCLLKSLPSQQFSFLSDPVGLSAEVNLLKGRVLGGLVRTGMSGKEVNAILGRPTLIGHLSSACIFASRCDYTEYGITIWVDYPEGPPSLGDGLFEGVVPRNGRVTRVEF
jgi:hypothetical protein